MKLETIMTGIVLLILALGLYHVVTFIDDIAIECEGSGGQHLRGYKGYICMGTPIIEEPRIGHNA